VTAKGTRLNNTETRVKLLAGTEHRLTCDRGHDHIAILGGVCVLCVCVCVCVCVCDACVLDGV